jgi:hypothetical protein
MHARLAVFTVGKVQVVILFNIVAPFSNIVGYRQFGGPCCFHLQGEDGDMAFWLQVRLMRW